MPLKRLVAWLGWEMIEVSLAEKAVAILGGGAAIGLLLVITNWALPGPSVISVVTSMGASAVLLFAVPHGPLSQPWPVCGGHVLSAIIGVACARWIAPTALAGACAVGLAIGAMIQCRCIHPPGGATALAAVIGGAAIRDRGFDFVWCPVALNALVMVILAVAVNFPFRWRRYPAILSRAPRPVPVPVAGRALTHDEIAAAVRSLDSFIDISEEDLVRLVNRLCPPPEKP